MTASHSTWFAHRRPCQVKPRNAAMLAVALLLTGRPGVGKTTVIRAAASRLTGFHLVGFYTEEIRVGPVRHGFRLRTFGGQEAIIAHISLPPPRVSKYGVDLAVIDRFADTLRDPHRS